MTIDNDAYFGWRKRLGTVDRERGRANAAAGDAMRAVHDALSRGRPGEARALLRDLRAALEIQCQVTERWMATIDEDAPNLLR